MAIRTVMNQSFPVPAEHAGKTLAAALRIMLPGQSWTQVRKLIEARRVQLNGEVEQSFGAGGLEAKLTIPLTHERWPSRARSHRQTDLP